MEQSELWVTGGESVPQEEKTKHLAAKVIWNCQGIIFDD